MNLQNMILLNVFNDGSPTIMGLILICLALAVFFLGKGFTGLKNNPKQVDKMLSLTGHVSLLGLVLGFLGGVVGMITAFDAVEVIGNVSPGIFAGGLKVSLLSLVFGAFAFAFSRGGMVVLKWLQKAE